MWSATPLWIEWRTQATCYRDGNVLKPKRRRGLAPLPPHSKELMFYVWLDLQSRTIHTEPVQITKRAE
jgi:hypothetical protein